MEQQHTLAFAVQMAGGGNMITMGVLIIFLGLLVLLGFCLEAIRFIGYKYKKLDGADNEFFLGVEAFLILVPPIIVGVIFLAWLSVKIATYFGV